MTEKRKRGRPPLKENAKSVKVEVRFTQEDFERIKNVAGPFGVPAKVIRAATLEFLDNMEEENL